MVIELSGGLDTRFISRDFERHEAQHFTVLTRDFVKCGCWQIQFQKAENTLTGIQYADRTTPTEKLSHLAQVHEIINIFILRSICKQTII